MFLVSGLTEWSQLICHHSLRKVLAGKTTVEEVLRVTNQEEVV
ncbi:hypothetical protein [Acinetobacter populi]|jgi:general secretion pathway protein E|nr:hypothetical protein [Acinetobacter populi]